MLTSTGSGVRRLSAGESFRIDVLNVPVPKEVLSEQIFAQLLLDLVPDLEPLVWEFPLLNGRFDLLCKLDGKITVSELKVGPDKLTYQQGLEQLKRYNANFRKMLKVLGLHLEYGLLLIMGIPEGMEKNQQEGSFQVSGVEVKMLEVKSLRTEILEDVNRLIETRKNLDENVSVLVRKAQELEDKVSNMDEKKELVRLKKQIQKENQSLERIWAEESRLRATINQEKRELREVRDKRMEVLNGFDGVYLNQGTTKILIGSLREGIFEPNENYTIFGQSISNLM